ncbi:MAG: hypothetical protein LBJ12_07925 [Oscillospiraceae bacterium]|jgi:hypothetical protein|nr:hypothetical protein [Oscillospiraceae bacterium]
MRIKWLQPPAGGCHTKKLGEQYTQLHTQYNTPSDHKGSYASDDFGKI